MVCGWFVVGWFCGSGQRVTLRTGLRRGNPPGEIFALMRHGRIPAAAADTGMVLRPAAFGCPRVCAGRGMTHCCLSKEFPHATCSKLPVDDFPDRNDALDPDGDREIGV